MTDWRAPSAVVTVPRNEVHVWRAPLDGGEREYRACHALLDQAEHRRAAAYRDVQDRRRFTMARGVTRTVLARYERTEPRAIRFCHGTYGKPALSDPKAPPIHFNVSYRSGVVLVAVSDVFVGVDVEHASVDLDLLDLAEHTFSRGENDALRALPPPLRRAAFLACWTRKEAFVKATGFGLSMPLDGFTVSVAPGEPAELLEVACDLRQAMGWRLRSFEAGSEYPCALAFRGRDRAVSFFDA